MTTLYAVAAERRALVAGTGNKVEDFGVGFYTKYGDGGVDLSPIADLLKSEVYALGTVLCWRSHFECATHRWVCGATTAPTRINWAPPTMSSSGRWKEWPKVEVRRILKAVTRHRAVMDIFTRHHTMNRHKMDPIPVCKLPEHLFQQRR